MATQFFRGGAFLAALLVCATAAAQDDDGFIGVLPATTVQLPTFGIAIDAEGTLDARTFKDFDRKLLRERLAAAKAAKPGELWAAAKLRKVSLVRLEAALAAEIAAGRGPDDVLRNLAGLTRVQYVFCQPAADGKPGDVILAGPAEPFALDAAGRAVGLASGKPVLQLDDLAAALRAYPPGKRERPFLGCTINPSADGLAKLVEFQKSVPRSVRVEDARPRRRSDGQGSRRQPRPGRDRRLRPVEPHALCARPRRSRLPHETDRHRRGAPADQDDDLHRRAAIAAARHAAAVVVHAGLQVRPPRR